MICNYLFEHVQDGKKGTRECYWVVKNGGIFIDNVPLSEKPETWELPAGMSVSEIEAIVGWDHKRYCGYDFTDKFKTFSFELEIFKLLKFEQSFMVLHRAI